MPKLKTNSGAKKRFRITKTLQVKCGRAYKRHGMRKRPPKTANRNNVMVLSEPDIKRALRLLRHGG